MQTVGFDLPTFWLLEAAGLAWHHAWHIVAFCAVRALQMPCMPLPPCLSVSLCLSCCLSVAGHHACHFLSVSVSLYIYTSLCTPVECHVLGHIWGNFCVSHAGRCLPLSVCLFPSVKAPTPILLELGLISNAMCALHLCCM